MKIDNRIIYEESKECVPDTMRYEVHYYDKSKDIWFYIGILDACYSFEDAEKHIKTLQEDSNVGDIELWEITESTDKFIVK